MWAAAYGWRLPSTKNEVTTEDQKQKSRPLNVVDNFNLQNTTYNFQLGFETMDQLAQIEGTPIIEYLTYEDLVLKNDTLPKEA